MRRLPIGVDFSRDFAFFRFSLMATGDA